MGLLWLCFNPWPRVPEVDRLVLKVIIDIVVLNSEL